MVTRRCALSNMVFLFILLSDGGGQAIQAARTLLLQVAASMNVDVTERTRTVLVVLFVSTRPARTTHNNHAQPTQLLSQKVRSPQQCA